jgi:hypothetical protein
MAKADDRQRNRKTVQELGDGGFTNLESQISESIVKALNR